MMRLTGAQQCNFVCPNIVLLEAVWQSRGTLLQSIMLVSFPSNLDKFHTADFTVVEDNRQIPAAARAVNPLNNINYIEPGGSPKQWITVQLDNGQLGTLVIASEKVFLVEPGDVVSVLLAKRGAFGRAQQTLAYIINNDTGQELYLPPSTILLPQPTKWISYASSISGLILTAPALSHLFKTSSHDPLFIAGCLSGTTLLFLLGKFASAYLIAMAVKNRRDKAFLENEVAEAIEHYRLLEV